MNHRRRDVREAARARMAGRLAALFSLVFGLGHLAWAAGIPVMGATSEQFDDIDQGSLDHLATEIGVGMLAFAGAAGALALVSPWGAAIPRRGRVLLAGIGTIVALAAAGYGVLGVILQGLAAADRYEFPSGHEATSPGWWVFWYVLFAVIGVAFLATAWLTRLGRRSLDQLDRARRPGSRIAKDALV